MPAGFVGQSCEKYLRDTSEAIEKAQAVKSQDPFEGESFDSDCPAPKLSSVSEPPKYYNPSDAKSSGKLSGSGGKGNSDHVAVDQDVYDEAIKLLRLVDESTARALYEVSMKIEGYCGSIYIIPDTLPPFLTVLNSVKSSLGEYQSLAEETGTTASRFANEIFDMDQGFK